jgi:uncharacterized alpha/beta hydrolase family protein
MYSVNHATKTLSIAYTSLLMIGVMVFLLIIYPFIFCLENKSDPSRQRSRKKKYYPHVHVTLYLFNESELNCCINKYSYIQ